MGRPGGDSEPLQRGHVVPRCDRPRICPARQQSLSLRSPPPEPTTCCGRGCNGCVWENYFAAVSYWCEEILEQLRAAQQAFAPGRVPHG
ncbi:MAG: oxidoreductase-like domain-containing protein [Polaromonas sp.]